METATQEGTMTDRDFAAMIVTLRNAGVQESRIAAMIATRAAEKVSAA